MVKYYTIVFPGEFGQHVQETWSEDQIIESYYKYWSVKMIDAGKGDDISRERCIEDWIVIHWAQETDEFGEIKTLEQIIHGATLMSDKGYAESTHEKQAEFAKNRNYHYTNTDNPIDFPGGFYDVGDMSLDEIKRRGRE